MDRLLGALRAPSPRSRGSRRARGTPAGAWSAQVLPRDNWHAAGLKPATFWLSEPDTKACPTPLAPTPTHVRVEGHVEECQVAGGHHVQRAVGEELAHHGGKPLVHDPRVVQPELGDAHVPVVAQPLKHGARLGGPGGTHHAGRDVVREVLVPRHVDACLVPVALPAGEGGGEKGGRSAASVSPRAGERVAMQGWLGASVLVRLRIS